MEILECRYDSRASFYGKAQPKHMQLGEFLDAENPNNYIKTETIKKVAD